MVLIGTALLMVPLDVVASFTKSLPGLRPNET